MRKTKENKMNISIVGTNIKNINVPYETIENICYNFTNMCHSGICPFKKINGHNCPILYDGCNHIHMEDWKEIIIKN